MKKLIEKFEELKITYPYAVLTGKKLSNITFYKKLRHCNTNVFVFSRDLKLEIVDEESNMIMISFINGDFATKLLCDYYDKWYNSEKDIIDYLTSIKYKHITSDDIMRNDREVYTWKDLFYFCIGLKRLIPYRYKFKDGRYFFNRNKTTLIEESHILSINDLTISFKTELN